MSLLQGGMCGDQSQALVTRRRQVVGAQAMVSPLAMVPWLALTASPSSLDRGT